MLPYCIVGFCFSSISLIHTANAKIKRRDRSEWRGGGAKRREGDMVLFSSMAL